MQYKTGSGGWTDVNVATGTTTTVTGLIPETKYTFQVIAVKGGVASDPSTTVEATTGKTGTTAPTTPTEFKIGTVTSTTVELSWKAITGATSYVLLYKTGTGEWSSANITFGANGTSATITGLTMNTPYKFTVQAKNDGGTSDSAETSVTTLAVVPAKPAAPTDSTAGIPTSDSVTLTWKTVTGADSYVVEYRAGTSGDWLTANVAITGTTATITGLAAGTTYYFQVAAVNGGVKSDVAATNATTKSTDTSKQQPPNNVKVVITAGKETKSATVTWTAPEGATNKTVYVIQYRIVTPNGTAKWKKATVKQTNRAGLTKDLKLKAGEEYEFQIFVKGVKRGAADSNAIAAGKLRAWKVIPTASLAKSAVTQNKIALQVKNYLSGDKPAIGKGSKSGVVDTLTVTYSWGKGAAKKTETVTLTYDGKDWIVDDLTLEVKFEGGVITIDGLETRTKYTVTAQFSKGSEATAVKATSKSLSTAK